MLNLFKFARKVSKQFTLVDRTIAKIDLVIVGLFLAKFFPALTLLHRWWYVAFILLAEIYFLWRISDMM